MGFTAVKDKAFERYKILAERVAPDTVNTKPMATLRAVADHVVIRSDAVRTRYDEAWDATGELARLGVDVAVVSAVLEQQGIASFVTLE
jgi:transaldolase